MKKMEESFGDILEDFGEIADDTWKDLSPEQKNKQKPKINQMIQKLQKLQQMQNKNDYPLISRYGN